MSRGTGRKQCRDQRDPAQHVTILSGDLDADDGPARVDEFAPCFSGADRPLESGCEAYDLDGDNDIDADDLAAFLEANNYADNSYHVVSAASGTNVTAVLDGFTITAGNANGSGDHHWGGGMQNSLNRPTIGNCIFSGNAARSRGAGMFNVTCHSNISLCRFSGNAAGSRGGGVSNRQSSCPTLRGCTFSGNAAPQGAGIANYKSSPRLTDCTFRQNWAGDGAGVFNVVGASPMLSGCTFSRKKASRTGAGMASYHSCNPRLIDCTFTGNSAGDMGGGMQSNENSSPTLTNCTFTGNSADWGGGVSNGRNSNPRLTNCTFSANTAGSGGGMYSHTRSNPTLINCTFSTNSARNGGGVAGENSSPTLTGCTFDGNTAGSAGGAVRATKSRSIRVANCIVWDNLPATGSQFALYDESGLAVSYSNVQGGHTEPFVEEGCTLNWGDGNIDADPLFRDADGPDDQFGTEDDDLRLQPGSPCIDAGDNAALPADVADLDGDGDTSEPIPLDLAGNPRVVNRKVDMGAYEFQSAAARPARRPSSSAGSTPLTLPRLAARQPDRLTTQPTAGTDKVGAALHRR